MVVDLHHIRHFVAVAEELHFGRAAARLRMAQPPLSQSIRRFEARLGFPLFTRTRRKVELTPAGRVFLIEARRILETVDEAVRLARLAAADDLTELSIGFVSAALYRVLPAALRRYRARFPGVAIRLDEQPTDVQIAQLRAGGIDLGFVHPPLRDAADLEVRTVLRDRMIAAVPATSPLARRRVLRLADLREENFVLFPRRLGPDLFERMVAACRAAGFVPRITQEARLMHTILSLVGAGMGVSLVPDGARTMAIDAVAFVPLVDCPDDLVWELAIVRRRRGVSRALRAFIEVVEGAAA